MTMHLEGPYLTTTRYTKRPHRKWASAEAKHRAESDAAAWPTSSRPPRLPALILLGRQNYTLPRSQSSPR